MNAMKHKLDRCGLLLAGVLLLAVSAGCSRSSNQPPPAAEPRGPDPNTVAVRVDTHALTWGELNTLATNYYVEESRRLHIPEGRETEVWAFSAVPRISSSTRPSCSTRRARPEPS